MKSNKVSKPKKQIKLHKSPSNTLAFQYSVFTYCLYFYRVANGKVASTEHQPPFYSGAELEFKCNLGFRLMQSRKKLHNRLICHDSGHWQPPRNYKNPKCIRKQCQRPRPIPYGRIITQVSIYLNNYFNFHVCLSFRFPLSMCLKTSCQHLWMNVQRIKIPPLQPTINKYVWFLPTSY